MSSGDAERAQLSQLWIPGYFVFQVSPSSPRSEVVRQSGKLESQRLPKNSHDTLSGHSHYTHFTGEETRLGR